ncbi:MAG TPA: sulfur carrier protein ThiS [Myxococcota bacterium]
MPPITEREVPLTVNGERRTVPPECTLDGLLQLLGLEGRRVAVAVNRDVVPRSGFAARRLAAGDRIEILEAVGGG